MRALQPFYFAQSPAGGDFVDTVIIQTASPYCVGRIEFYRSLMEMTLAVNNSQALAHYIVTGYNIAIFFAGAVTGSRLAVTPSTLEQIQGVMQQMADFFSAYKVAEKPTYYEKKFSSHKH